MLYCIGRSEFARSVEEYSVNFERQRGKKIELVNIDTKDGSDMARLYDVTRYPAVLATRDSGEMMAIWQDDHLPLMNEVAAYFD